VCTYPQKYCIPLSFEFVNKIAVQVLPMDSLTPIQRQIIAYIIAENEETEEPNPLTPYMHALSGGLMPDMYFTLYQEKTQKKAGLVLYAEEHEGEPNEHFREHCRMLKDELLVITDFMEYLVQKGYVRILERYGYPPDIPRHWQKYEDFTCAEAASLSFACSSMLVPRLIYTTFGKNWESRH
jgi:hypothetical protein